MKLLVLTFGVLIAFLFITFKSQVIDNKSSDKELIIDQVFSKDTFMIDSLVFRIINYKRPQKLDAYIKNRKIYVENQGLQYTEYRVAYYVFSSLSDERMPIIRHFDEKLSFPVIKVLKTTKPGNMFLFEEIIVIDPSNKKLNNTVKPIVIVRID